MSLQFAYLKDHPELVPTVIRWWHTVWADRMGTDFENLEKQLLETLSKPEFPVHVLAFTDNVPVAVAALKLHELEDLFPQNLYWLGSVYVDEIRRGTGLGSKITERIIQIAHQRELPHLYLQTQDLSGGLYAELGWQPLQKLSVMGEDTLLMIKQLNSHE